MALKQQKKKGKHFHYQINFLMILVVFVLLVNKCLITKKILVKFRVKTFIEDHTKRMGISYSKDILMKSFTCVEHTVYAAH